MNKNIVKGIVGIAVLGSLTVALTGCGNKEDKVKQYAKEAENEVNSAVQYTVNEENKTTSNNVDEENKKNNVANEAIKNALKDKNWIKKNIIPVMFVDDNNAEEEYNMHTFYFEKIEDDKVPTYIVEARNSYALAVLVSYKNNKVTVSKKCIEVSALGDEDANASVDVQNKIVIELPDSYDTQENIYKIKDGEFEPILNWEFGEIVDGTETRNYFYEGKKINWEEYDGKKNEYLKKFSYQSISKKITNENVDKYVK